MQKCAEQNTNIKEGNYYSLLKFHALGDHQTESCLREVVSYICLKFKNGWRNLDRSKCLPLKQEIRAGNEMPPRKQVFRSNQ